MLRRRSQSLDLPEDVVLSVQGLSRAKAPEEPELPAWLARILPKSGIAGQAGGGMDDDEMMDFLDDQEEPLEPTALAELSFEVRRGEGLGILGADTKAREALMRILAGAVPPSAGRVVVRGQLAALHRQTLTEYSGAMWGPDAVFVVARFLGWPRHVLRRKWEEIEAFAATDELKHLPTRKYRLQMTTRLLFSAGLHMDATVYVVDSNLPSDFRERMYELLEKRRSEGAAIVQGAQKMVEDVARLCDEAIWLEEGGVKYSGPLLDVAVAVARAYREELDPLSVPVSAALPGNPEVVEVSPNGGLLDVDLSVLRKNLEIGLTLELEDRHGHTVRIEQPEPFVADLPAMYRLRLSLPAGLLAADNAYRARLIRQVRVIGGKHTEPAEMLAFDLVSNADESMALESNGTLQPIDELDEELLASSDEVGWHVSRATA